VLLKRAAKLAKASGQPNKMKVAEITRSQLQEIAEIKKNDLNAADLDAAVSMIAGTARSMGITIKSSQ
jgi:large subunit ribosomal protein L11